MQKIVVLINSLSNGGAERVCSLLLNNFINKYKCYVIVIHLDDIFYELDKRIEVINLNEKLCTNGFIKIIRLPILSYKLSKIISDNNFSKILSFLTRSNYINILASYISKHHTIISERAMPSLQYQFGFNGIINKFMIKMLYSKSNQCLSNSYGNMIDLKENFNVQKIQYIYNPFDTEAIERISKKEIDIKKKKFTFLTVGRLDHGKNHKLMINAIKDIDADLWIIGDGKLKKELQKYIDELQINEKVYLFGKKENPFSYVSKADCFVFTSNHEGFPNVLVEALACGQTVISTDCKSGPREILAPNTSPKYQLKDNIELAEYGVLVPIKNALKLKEAMNLIMIDEKLRKNYQECAKRRANDFKIEKIIKQYEKILCVV